LPATDVKRSRQTMSGKGIAAVLLTVLLSGCSKPPPAPDVIRPVRAVRAGDVSTLDGRWFPGKAQATQEVNLAFRVSGPLVEFPVMVGDIVTAGQVLARIDPRDFQVELRNAQAQLDEAEALVVLREDEYARAQTAHAKGGISDIELSRQLAARDRSRATVASNEAAVEAPPSTASSWRRTSRISSRSWASSRSSGCSTTRGSR
jgi:multidrug efflux pump subunit AcrA (membrane-fusion protein)